MKTWCDDAQRWSLTLLGAAALARREARHDEPIDRRDALQSSGPAHGAISAVSRRVVTVAAVHRAALDCWSYEIKQDEQAFDKSAYVGSRWSANRGRQDEGYR